ncbi:hypothetical protein LY90DRAFT_519565 [Neocallimastix californiae]|uniref:TFIIS N-terminal domain-containing protein n=1 Tax=Neocallimastix californiae TaxID=1754190 RepID=A0A1Y1YZ06_9FUNG|nr:hypothetical protein LY90DRAFT_519565 [Neocallimastix californiae]|eukprot:ORY03251.1 hypothetical protein LY90DRAFT_519565 [Neocallimastix californiae]
MGLIWESEETIQLRKVFQIRESKIGKLLSIISRLNIPEYDINKRAEALLTKWKTYIPTPVAVSLYEAAVNASEQNQEDYSNFNYSLNTQNINDNLPISDTNDILGMNDLLFPMNGRRRRRRNIYINDSFSNLTRMLYNNNNNNNNNNLNGVSSSNSGINALLRDDDQYNEENITLLGNGGRRREERTRYYSSLLNASPSVNRTSHLTLSSSRINRTSNLGLGNPNDENFGPTIVLNSDNYSLSNNITTPYLLSGNIMASPLPDTDKIYYSLLSMENLYSK